MKYILNSEGVVMSVIRLGEPNLVDLATRGETIFESLKELKLGKVKVVAGVVEDIPKTQAEKDADEVGRLSLNEDKWMHQKLVDIIEKGIGQPLLTDEDKEYIKKHRKRGKPNA